jgi:hypothetical protein
LAALLEKLPSSALVAVVHLQSDYVSQDDPDPVAYQYVPLIVLLGIQLCLILLELYLLCLELRLLLIISCESGCLLVLHLYLYTSGNVNRLARNDHLLDLRRWCICGLRLDGWLGLLLYPGPFGILLLLPGSGGLCLSA